MNKPHRLPSAAAVASIAAAIAAAPAQEYTFTNVADNTGEFQFFGHRPTLNDSGAVAFLGIRDDFSTGAFVWEDGKITTMAESGGLFSLVTGEVSINNSGVVAFRAWYAQFQDGVFKSDGETITGIADSDGAFRAFGNPAINDHGEVAFQTLFDNGHQGIFTRAGGDLNTIIRTDPPFADLDHSPSINSEGRVAFIADWLDPHLVEGILVGDGDTRTIIAATDRTFNGVFDHPDINTHGEVVLTGTTAPGVYGIYVGNGGEPRPVVTNADGFMPFLGAAINDAGDVVFHAFFTMSRDGLFTGRDPERDAIIRLGDPLFGSRLSDLMFLRALNNRGQVAFFYELEDGREGIALATPPDLCPADLDGSGSVDVNDFFAFLDLFASGDDRADFTGDGTIAVDDLFAFLDAFAAGC